MPISNPPTPRLQISLSEVNDVLTHNAFDKLQVGVKTASSLTPPVRTGWRAISARGRFNLSTVPSHYETLTELTGRERKLSPPSTRTMKERKKNICRGESRR